MFCSKCGSRLPDGARFCDQCGTPVAGGPAQKMQYTPQNQQSAQKPGDASQGMTYAAQEPRRMAQDRQRTQQPPRNGGKKPSRLPLILGLIALLAALVLLFIFVLLPMMKKDNPETASQSESGQGASQGPEAASSENNQTGMPDPFASYEYNSNSRSMWGTVTHYRGYTYFTAEGLNNDCSVNGEADADNIYRISDAADAQPELVYSVPARIEAGTDQNTIFFLTGCGDRIYFYEQSNERSGFAWISLDGSRQGIVSAPEGMENMLMRNAFIDEGLVYCKVYTEDPEGGRRTGTMVLNLLTEKWQEYRPAFLDSGSLQENNGIFFDSSGRFVYSLTFSHGYEYFLQGTVKDDEPRPDQGLYRVRAGSDKVEEVGALALEEGSDNVGMSFVYATEQAFYFIPTDDMDGAYEEDALYALWFEDGSVKKILGGEQGLADEYFPTLCISEDEIWYVAEDGLYCCDPDGGNARCVARDPNGETKMAPAICGDWIVYSMSDHPKYVRMAKDGRIFPSEPMVEKDYQASVTEGTEGDWTYQKYPAFICVTGYTGSETEVTVPETIAGLPVRTVSGWQSGGTGWGSVKVLKLPESVVSVSYLYIQGLERIELPAGFEVFNHRSFEYSFRTDGLLTVVYPGTVEQFEEIRAHSLAMNDMEGIDCGPEETTYHVICQDGEFDAAP